MVYQPLNWKKQTCLATVCFAHKTRYFVFVLLLVIVQKLQEIVTKAGYLVWGQTIFQNLFEMLRIWIVCGIVRANCPRRYFSDVVGVNWALYKGTLLYGLANTTVNFHEIVVNHQRLEQLTMRI